MRIGHGYDVHRLVPGRALILGGVRIDYPLGLDGHSDADVLTHAVMDALLGAAGLGDIGRHFPDSDPAFKGIDSQKLLARLEECCPHATLLDAKGNELRRIISVCYNGGVFLSKAFYSNDVHNLVSIPLDCDIVADCGIIYKNKHRPVVDKFLGVVREIYPI